MGRNGKDKLSDKALQKLVVTLLEYQIQLLLASVKIYFSSDKDWEIWLVGFMGRFLSFMKETDGWTPEALRDD